MDWDDYQTVLERFPLPLPWIPHPCSATVAAWGYLREEPYAGKPPVRICEGEAEWLSHSTTVRPKAGR
jgi:hypothetical protein